LYAAPGRILVAALAAAALALTEENNFF
jgi:hypothetical protein